LDGLEATRQIREAVPKTEVLILTMHESDQMVRRVLEAGARGYVLKSDLGGCLVQAVKSVSDGKRFLTPKVSEIVLEGFLKAASEPKRRKLAQGRTGLGGLALVCVDLEGVRKSECQSEVRRRGHG